MPRPRHALPLLAAVLLIAAAIAQPQLDVPNPTILDYLFQRRGNFEIFLAGIRSLTPTLFISLGDPTADLTIFSPTDATFGKLVTTLRPDLGIDPDNTTAVLFALIDILAPPTDPPATRNATLADIWSYHALPASFSFKRLETMGMAATVQGDSLSFALGRVIDRDPARPDATVKSPGVTAQNGIIYIPDSVLLPSDTSAIQGGKPPKADDGAVALSEADAIKDAIVPDPRTTIVGYLAAQPDKFGVLVGAAATVPGLVATLDDPKKRFTLFPPTDAAFLNLAKRLVPDADLDLDNKEEILTTLATAIAPLENIIAAKNSTVASILSYHLLGDAYPFQKLAKKGKYPTAQGDELKFKMGKVIDADPSRPDPAPMPRNTLTKNGWVHVIDSVLLPFDLEALIGPAQKTPLPSPGIDPVEETPLASPEDDGSLDISETEGIDDAIIPSPLTTILGYLASKPGKFGVLAALAGLVPGLPGLLDTPSERLTLFAPTDEAFAKLARTLVPDAEVSDQDPSSIVAVLGPAIAPLENSPAANFSTVASILSYHLATMALPFQALQTDGSVQTAQGLSLTIEGNRVIDADPFLPDAKATRRNIFTKNGWVHTIDSVLLPFNLEEVVQEATASPGPDSSAEPTESPDSSAEPMESPPATSGSTPSPAPSTSQTGDDDGVCFPSTASLRLEGGAPIRMSVLQAGHSVHVGSGKTSKVFAFTHKTASRTAFFHELTTAAGHSVSMTGNHYLYANGAMTAASAVRVGDVLKTVSGNSPVVKIRVVKGQGLYAPHTIHGDLEVDGVVVSGYSTAVHPSIAHALFAPVRALSRYAGVVEPLGGLFYNGANSLLPLIPKGSQKY